MLKPLLFTLVTVLAVTGATSASRADGDAAHGKTLFGRCSACHALTEQNKVGPSLAGVVGRAAGSVAGFRYSKAMAASGWTWDAATLDSFLAGPSKALPGTTMTVSLPSAQDRADLIAYLETVPAP